VQQPVHGSRPARSALGTCRHLHAADAIPRPRPAHQPTRAGRRVPGRLRRPWWPCGIGCAWPGSRRAGRVSVPRRRSSTTSGAGSAAVPTPPRGLRRSHLRARGLAWRSARPRLIRNRPGIRYRTGAMGHLAPFSYPDPGPAARIW